MTSGNNSSNIEVTAGGWMDYAGANGPRSAQIASDHRRNALDPAGFAGRAPYWPLTAGQLRCVSSPDPVGELDVVVAKAALKQDWRGLAYRTAADGFLQLLPADAGRVRIPRGVRWSSGTLVVKMANLLGLHLPGHGHRVITLYNKKPQLTTRQAACLLVILDEVREQTLPDARVEVWDNQRARAFTLADVEDVETVRDSVRQLAKRYVGEWNLAA